MKGLYGRDVDWDGFNHLPEPLCGRDCFVLGNRGGLSVCQAPLLALHSGRRPVEGTS